ncbi:MAG: glycosyltransferase family 2 protein [Flavobacteriales bacterium]
MSNSLSVITICLNDRAGLERTFESVFSQTTQNFDLVVVDGGSTDGSKELIEQNKERVTRWVSEKDNGIYDAQNKGWRMAGTEFVQFLNAGDVFAEVDVLENVLPLLTEEVDTVYGNAALADHRGRYGLKVHPDPITSAWLMKEVISHSAQFIRRSLLQQFNGYDTRFGIAADYAFFAQAFWNGDLRLKKWDQVVTIFNTEGVSSDPIQKERIARERKMIQRQFAPAFWYWLYHTYATINRAVGR